MKIKINKKKSHKKNSLMNKKKHTTHHRNLPRTTNTKQTKHLILFLNKMMTINQILKITFCFHQLKTYLQRKL